MTIVMNSFEGHPEIYGDTEIWRYMSFDRYIYLITSRRLWFSRIDKVGDRFEGSSTHASYQLWKAAYEAAVPPEIIDKTLFDHSEGRKTLTRMAMANCWHAADDEKMHMWKLYSDNNGIAIRSTPNDIGNSLTERCDLFINHVRYMDYSEFGRETTTRSSFISQVSSRPDYLKYENEVRLVVTNPELPADSPRFDLLPEGVGVAIDPSILITRAVIRPEAESWVYEVTSKLHELLGLKVNLTTSKFGFDPVW